MDTHVKIIAIIYIVFGALGLLAGLLLMVVFGGAASIVSVAGQGDADIAVPIIAIVGFFLTWFLILTSLPSVVAGVGLLKYANWARILVIVLSVLGLINFPIGTLIGVYALWAMLNEETNQLFRTGGPQVGPPPQPPMNPQG